MNFNHHGFISYAHIDNGKTSEEDKGWVTRFHEYLEVYLARELGETVKIWRDTKLRGNDDFNAEISQQLGHSAILLSLVSQRYVKSDSCLKEFNEFRKATLGTAGILHENKLRTVRVMLKEFEEAERKELPDIFQIQLGYDFFKKDGSRVRLALQHGRGGYVAASPSSS